MLLDRCTTLLDRGKLTIERQLLVQDVEKLRSQLTQLQNASEELGGGAKRFWKEFRETQRFNVYSSEGTESKEVQGLEALCKLIGLSELAVRQRLAKGKGEFTMNGRGQYLGYYVTVTRLDTARLQR